MARDTSIESFNKIRDDGLLSERRWQVYEILFKNGPLTAHEVVMLGRRDNPFANQTGWNARISELEKMGIVESVGEKINPISGHKNILWDVTSKLPIKLEKKKKTKCPHCQGKGFINED